MAQAALTGGTHSTTAWREVLQLFERWLAAPAEQREPLLDAVREQQPQLSSRLIAMIEADREAEVQGFLNQPPAVLQAVPASAGGTRLGAWELIEVIGTGGMGQVWLAARCDGLHAGRAAVKMLRTAHGGRAADARFAREGEFLARLTHPHIAQLMDAGIAPGGARYLVLEHVQGERLDRWCDARRLDVRARVRLFLQVCEAVAFAHTHLVVHRDLKPPNILVNEAGQVKLLDFGVAKLLDEGGAGVEFTHTGVAGLTPEYAAPEQVNGEAVGTATDVYSLGVVLFELVAGCRPYGLPGNTPALWARAIVELQPQRLADAYASTSADLSAMLAECRSSTVLQLRRTLRGDLETIVAKALRKQPAQRYATVQMLHQDLLHWLNHEPVSARPDSVPYRVGKFVQRHRAQVLALVSVLSALLVGVAATTWQWRASVLEAQRTRTVVQVLTDLFTGLSPDQSGAATVPVVDLLRRAWSDAKRNLAADAALQAEVARPLGMLLTQSGDMGAAAQALALSRAHLAHSGLRRTREYLEVTFELAHAQRSLGQYAAARDGFRDVIETSARFGGLAMDRALNAMVKLGEMDTDDGKLDDARAALATAAEVARQRLGPQHRVYLSAKTALSSVARSQGRWDEARELLVVVADAASGSPRSDALAYRLNLATLDVEMGNHRQAIPALAAVTRDMDDLLGGGDTSTITARTWLAAAYFRGGDPDAAQREIDDAYAQAQRSSEPDVAHEVQLVRARQLMRRGRVDSAEPLLRASLAHFETRETSQQPYTERARALLGECLLRRGDLDGALALLSRAAQAQHRIYPQPDVDLWPTELLLALVMQARGDRPEAEAHYRRALDVVRAVLPPAHPDLHRVQSIAALAAWRHEPSQTHRDELGSALDAYANSLEGRFDSKAFPVLRDGLLVNQPEAEMSIHDMVSLLND